MNTKLAFLWILLMLFGVTTMAQTPNMTLRTPRKIAVLIGYDCREREENPAYKITYAQEVKAMKDCLVKRGFEPENVLCLTTDAKAFWLRPKRENVFAVLNLAAANLTEPEDTMVVMLAGYGGMGTGKEWFLPIGSTLAPSEVWIDVEEILACMDQCKAGKKLFINLCGRQVIYRSPEEIQQAIQKAEPQKSRKKHSFLTVYSCQLGTIANLNEKGDMSLFLTYLLKNLNESKGDLVDCVLSGFPQISREIEKISEEKCKTPQIPSLD